jgi:DNA-binding XRE family transcriptional regulator
MLGFGLKQDDVAKVIGISDVTLRLHYANEIETAEPEANAQVAQSLFQMATKGKNVTAAIWWTKTRMGWKEVTGHEITGADGAPLTYVVRAPTPVESPNEWLKQHAPKSIAQSRKPKTPA